MKRIILTTIALLTLTVPVTALSVRPARHTNLTNVGVAHPTLQLHAQQAGLFSASSPQSTEILQ